MKATVCEMPDDRSEFGEWWERLGTHVKREGSGLVLLPEMPFVRWMFASRRFSRGVWDRSVEEHGRWMGRLPELGVAFVAGSRPVEVGRRRFNEGFVWSAGGKVAGHHRKRYLPDQPGFYEAPWYTRGERKVSAFEVRGWRAGFLICSDLWSVWNARAYGKEGADVIMVPRATGLGVDKWLAGGRAAAVVSGAYCLSSNRSRGRGAARFGGLGWVVDPDGEVLGLTSSDEPFVTVEIVREKAREAKRTYPRDSFGTD
ncbi:MAG: carbon-nitrogen hydrolase family protein [Nitrososphaerota archaeon]|jgi:N-carbamoylputrescine amidase|nr:carbon-nitrogen hydrolase family protein [Nitrososphaerota archaeon]MDG6903915.1 carbon-nitrogen hydrolase family protein [Nitrososphaerota archaeon]MDG6913476.1 carbon-nitrogen hydrolase family protein [Nitrososphaerota archaeon]MDG6919172.1 carbon-nitrogen hydrolase family protein [Nitrososphaerota archaeon]MDG6924849.1 carbon-nitrogen hydrolase family protein [Nitrososphaerota archaeon]